MDRIMDKFSLAGKTALVTGGCYGIGFAIATALHSAQVPDGVAWRDQYRIQTAMRYMDCASPHA